MDGWGFATWLKGFRWGDIDESNMGNLWLWVDFFDIGNGNIHGFLL